MELLIIVLISSALAAFLSAMSGGGASIITLPVFMWTGMSLPLAIAVNKVSALFWTPVSAYSYLKGRKINWGFLFLFAFVGLIGAYFGVQFVLGIDEELLKFVIGIIIFGLVIYTYFKKDLGLKEKDEKSTLKKILTYPFALLMGFYESIVGSGNGIAFAVLTFHTRGFDFIDALGYYFGIAFFWVGFATLLYAQKGFFDFWIMLVAVIGSIIGSYAGSRYAKFKGNRFIKMIFIAIGAVLGLKLMLGL